MRREKMCKNIQKNLLKTLPSPPFYNGFWELKKLKN